jgi:hypothetical protein
MYFECSISWLLSHNKDNSLLECESVCWYVGSSEMLMLIYQTTRHHITEDRNLNTNLSLFSCLGNAFHLLDDGTFCRAFAAIYELKSGLEIVLMNTRA